MWSTSKPILFDSPGFKWHGIDQFAMLRDSNKLRATVIYCTVKYQWKATIHFLDGKNQLNKWYASREEAVSFIEEAWGLET